VHLSVLAEPDASCNQILPAEDRYNLTFDPPRPPGPSGGRLAFNTLPMPAQPVAVKKEPKHYTLDYYFDGMVNFKTPFQLAPVLDMARAMPAARVEIVGFRSGALLSNGQVMLEQADIARRRAEQVVELLQGAGLTETQYSVRWVDAPSVLNGTDDYRNRKVEIILLP
jgi:hypothetical protein